MSRVLVVAPQLKELSALCAGFGDLGYSCEPERVGKLDCQAIPSLGLILGVGGHGKAQFAIQTQHLLDVLEPRPTPAATWISWSAKAVPTCRGSRIERRLAAPQ